MSRDGDVPSRIPGALLAATVESVTRDCNAWIEVDLDALEHNLHHVRQVIGKGIEVIGVVKANAYGHGVAGVGPWLEHLGVDRFAVVWVGEGVALRRLGIRRPILVLGHSFPADAVRAVDHGLTLTCHSAALGDAISRAASAAGTVAKVHIKIDTGLHRFGNELEEAVALAEHLRRFPGLEVEGLSTHMANADEEDDSFSDLQREVFERAVARLPWIPFRHVANSATAFRRPDLRYDAVRCGIALYGVEPPNTPSGGLRPVLALRARVARVTTVEPGEGVSYGLTWSADRPSRLALVPVGYADGWRRALSSSGVVLMHGQRCPVVGRVAMDQFLADVTDVPVVAEGAEVTLIGSAGEERMDATEVARRAGTISWEILAGLQDRLPRLFHRGGVLEPGLPRDPLQGLT